MSLDDLLTAFSDFCQDDEKVLVFVLNSHSPEIFKALDIFELFLRCVD